MIWAVWKCDDYWHDSCTWYKIVSKEREITKSYIVDLKLGKHTWVFFQVVIDLISFVCVQCCSMTFLLLKPVNLQAGDRTWMHYDWDEDGHSVSSTGALGYSCGEWSQLHSFHCIFYFIPISQSIFQYSGMIFQL